MANVYEGRANFLHGLSDLWNRFFKEKTTLEAMYKGTEILAGQAYLDLVGNILCLSQREVPVFRKEFFKLLTVREDLVTVRDDGNWELEITDSGVKSFEYMYNKIFDPTVVLENNIHFYVSNDLTDAVVFYTNPFDWDGLGNTVPGVASRSVTVVDDDGDTTTERELAFWIPDAQIDNYDMYLNFGHLVGRFEPSSEAYRSLIQGITQYFVLGPTQEHLLSAMNVIVGLSVIRDDEEVLQSVDESGEEENLVVTDRASYSFPKIVPIRDDLLDESNWGVYEFVAFENLTKVFQVFDHVIDPVWWLDREIPEKLLPDESKLRRQVTPEMHENLVNSPYGLVKVGDPGLFVGADDDGYVPELDAEHTVPYTGPGYEENTTLWRPTYRHTFGYIVYERFLKHHTFVVDFDHDVLQSGVLPFELLADDLANIIDAGKSAYTYMIAEPGILFTDRLKVDTDTQDKLDIEVDMTVLPDEMAVTDTRIIVGETTVLVGDYYRYTGAETVGVFHAPWPSPALPDASGNTPVVVGGDDPSKEVESEPEVTSISGSITIPIATLGTGLFAVPTGAPTFSSSDVGKHLRQATTGDYYVIQEYVAADKVRVLPKPSGTVGPDTWDLYAESPAAVGDIPVEITVTPVP